MDEAVEREEQEMLARRDAQMQELANAQEMEARRQQALDTADMEGQADGADDGPRGVSACALGVTGR